MRTLTKSLLVVGICAAVATSILTHSASALPDPQNQSPNAIVIKPYTTPLLSEPYSIGGLDTNTLTFNRAFVIDTMPGQVPLITLRGMNKSTNLTATTLSLFFKVATVSDPTTLSDTNLYQTRSDLVLKFTLANNARINEAQSITGITNSRQLILYKVGINSADLETNALGQSFTISNLTATVWR